MCGCVFVKLVFEFERVATSSVWISGVDKEERKKRQLERGEPSLYISLSTSHKAMHDSVQMQASECEQDI